MIVVDRLSKRYGSFQAVHALSFAVERGEIVGLIGPNGAGKTSTLRCLAGIHAPSDGHVSINGHDIVGEPVQAKQQLAFMADEPQLFEYLTVTEHLQLTARIYGVKDFSPRASALIDEFELRGKEQMLPNALSRGMKQKVAIACGLIHSPTVLIFDEPLTGLDPLGIRHMKETIVARGREGAAIIVSSHLLHLVEEICTRILIIDKGAKVADGTLAELQAKAASGSNLEQIFLAVTARES